MKKIGCFYKKNFLKLLLVRVLITIIGGIYCLPISFEEFKNFSVQLILGSFAFWFPVLIAKMNNFTGATEFFSKYFPFKYFWTPMFLVGILLFLLGVFTTIRTRSFGNTVFFIPSLFAEYSAFKTYQMYQDKLNENRE